MKILDATKAEQMRNFSAWHRSNVKSRQGFIVQASGEGKIVLSTTHHHRNLELHNKFKKKKAVSC